MHLNEGKERERRMFIAPIIERGRGRGKRVYERKVRKFFKEYKIKEIF